MKRRHARQRRTLGQLVMRTGPHTALVIGPPGEVRMAYRHGGRVVIEDEPGVAKHVRKLLRREL